MKVQEINLKGLNEINLEAELEAVQAGSGTYEEIEEAVENGKISLLKDNDGNVIGINYNSGKAGVEDALEGMKFSKRFLGHDVMSYIYKALTGKELIDEESEVHDEYIESGLPVEITVDPEALGYVVNEKSIAKFLRDEFDHYLSGNETPFQYKYEEGDEYVEITNIHWGRKRYTNN